MTKGAFERPKPVAVRMRKERARTVNPSNELVHCTRSTGGGTEERSVADGRRRH